MVNFLTAYGAGEQISLVGNLHTNTAAHTLAPDGSDVTHQLEQVGAFHLKHYNVVLEGRDEHDVAAAHDTLGHIVAQTAHIDESHVCRFQTCSRSALHHHISSPVAKQTLGAACRHCNLAYSKYRSHHAIYTCLVGSHQSHRISRRHRVKLRSHLHPLPRKGMNPVILGRSIVKSEE